MYSLSLLGGSWVVISGVTSRVTVVIIHIKGLITPLITTHEPPSSLPTFSERGPGAPAEDLGLRVWGLGVLA